MTLYKHAIILLLYLASCKSQDGPKQSSDRPVNYDDKELFFDTRPNPLNRDAGDVVTFGILDRDGNKWFTTLTEGVYKYDGTTFTNITTKEGLCSNKVNSVLEDNDGVLWFATSTGLCRYDGEVFTSYELPKERPEDISPETGLPSRESTEILSIIQDKKGDLWLGTIAKGAYCFDEAKFTSYLKYKGRVQPRDSVYNNVIQSMINDDFGNVWFTSQTHGGISRYNGKEFTHFTMADGLPDDMIFSSFKDRDGTLWFGSLDKGLIVFRDGEFEYFDEADGLNNNMVSCFYQDKNGKLWIGSFRESTVTIYENGKFSSVTFDPDNKLVELRFIAGGKNGNVWFGGRYGLLYQYDGTRLIDFTTEKKN